MSGRERAIAYLHATQAAVCERVEPWEHGHAIFAPDIAAFWAYNTVRVEGPDAGLGVEEVVAACERIQSGLAHRRVDVEDQAAGERVRPGFEALGWMVERTVWMELEGPATGNRPAMELSEVPFERTRPLREAWFATWEWSPSAEEGRAFMALEEHVAARRGTRALATWGPAGEMIGFASFSVAGGSAEVEQVYVIPDRRGGGTGGALVAAAVDATGAGHTFILADDEGDPKRLYARLGFRPVWIQHVFTRRPA